MYLSFSTLAEESSAATRLPGCIRHAKLTVRSYFPHTHTPQIHHAQSRTHTHKDEVCCAAAAVRLLQLAISSGRMVHLRLHCMYQTVVCDQTCPGNKGMMHDSKLAPGLYKAVEYMQTLQAEARSGSLVLEFPYALGSSPGSKIVVGRYYCCRIFCAKTLPPAASDGFPESRSPNNQKPRRIWRKAEETTRGRAVIGLAGCRRYRRLRGADRIRWRLFG